MYGKTTCDRCIFVKKFYDWCFIILFLNMDDDILIVGGDIKKIWSLKKS